jgi:hypothetical protein
MSDIEKHTGLTEAEIQKVDAAGLLNKREYERILVTLRYDKLKSQFPGKSYQEIRGIIAEEFSLTDKKIQSIIYPLKQLKSG